MQRNVDWPHNCQTSPIQVLIRSNSPELPRSDETGLVQCAMTVDIQTSLNMSRLLFKLIQRDLYDNEAPTTFGALQIPFGVVAFLVH